MEILSKLIGMTAKKNCVNKTSKQCKKIRKEKNTSESRALQELLQNMLMITANYTFIHKTSKT